ncbi:MAG: Uncharacterised protein [Rhodospirillaceae bacterium]|nr:hypothetical protein [Alphaproteobacteria bacterium]CAI8397872.1 MAG: Uncharacterised protein [Rhodospirillaceae bacterium]
MPEHDHNPAPKTEVEDQDQRSDRDGDDTAPKAAGPGSRPLDQSTQAPHSTQVPQAPQPMGWQAYGIIAFLGGVIIAILGIGWQIWFSVDTAMDPFAWWLIGGALVISVLLGGGLLLLLHYSSRHHDHRVYDADHFQKWHRR